MIIIDFSPCLHSAFHVIANELTSPTIDLVRHVTLNTIRTSTARWKKEYGECVLAIDSSSWRKSVFPLYKADRKKKREDSDVDWELLFSHMRIVQEELEQFYPGRVVKVQDAEADDIIAVLCKEFHTQEKILVISPDNDMRQLMKYPGVSVYSPMTKTLHRMKVDRTAEVKELDNLLNDVKIDDDLDGSLESFFG